MSVDLSKTRMARVSLTDSPVDMLPAMLTDYRWNGWECPYFARALFAEPEVRVMFEKNAALINELSDGGMRAGWDDTRGLPSIVTITEDGEYEEVATVTSLFGAELVSIGWGFFTWEERR